MTNDFTCSDDVPDNAFRYQIYVPDNADNAFR